MVLQAHTLETNESDKRQFPLPFNGMLSDNDDDAVELKLELAH